MKLLSRNLLVLLIGLFVAALLASSTHTSSPLPSMSTNPTESYQSDVGINSSSLLPLDTSINTTIDTPFTTSACTTAQITAPDGRCIDVVEPTVSWNLAAADQTVIPWTAHAHTTVDGLNTVPIHLTFHHSISAADVPPSATFYIHWERYRQQGDEWVLDYSSSLSFQYSTLLKQAFDSWDKPVPVGTFRMKITFKTLYSKSMSPAPSVDSPIIRIYSSCFATLKPSYTLPTSKCTGGQVCRENGTCNQCADGFYATNQAACVEIKHPTITFEHKNVPISGSIVLQNGEMIKINALALIGDQNGGDRNNLLIGMKMYHKKFPHVTYSISGGFLYNRNTGSSDSIQLPRFPDPLIDITTMILEIETTSIHAIKPKKLTNLEITVIPTCMNSVTESNCHANSKCIYSSNACQCTPPYTIGGPSSCVLPYIDPIISSVTYTNHRTTQPEKISHLTYLFVGSDVVIRLQQPSYDSSTKRLGPAVVIVEFNGFHYASAQLAATDGAFVDVKIKLPMDTGNQIGILKLTVRRVATGPDLLVQDYELHTMPLCFDAYWTDSCSGLYGQCNIATNKCDCIDNFIEVNYRCVRPGPVITVHYEVNTPESTQLIAIQDNESRNIHPNALITIKIVSTEAQTANISAQFFITNVPIVKTAEVNNSEAVLTFNAVDVVGSELAISIKTFLDGASVQPRDLIYSFTVKPICLEPQSDAANAEWADICENGVCNFEENSCKCANGLVLDESKRKCVEGLPTIITAYKLSQNDDFTVIQAGSSTNVYGGTVIEVDLIPNVGQTSTITATLTNKNANSVVKTQEIALDGDSEQIMYDLASDGGVVYELTLLVTIPNVLVPQKLAYTFTTWSKCFDVPSDQTLSWIDTCGNGDCNQNTGVCDCDEGSVYNSNNKCITLTTPTVTITDDNSNTLSTTVTSDLRAESSITLVFSPDEVNPTTTNVAVSFEIDSEYLSNGTSDAFDGFEFDFNKDSTDDVTKVFKIPILGKDYNFTVKIVYTLHSTTSTVEYAIKVYPACWAPGTGDNSYVWNPYCEDSNASCIDEANECQCNLGYLLYTTDTDDSDSAKCTEIVYPGVEVSFINVDDQSVIVPFNDDGDNDDISTYVGTVLTIKFTPDATLTLPTTATVHLKTLDNEDSESIHTTITVNINNESVTDSVTIPLLDATSKQWFVAITMVADAVAESGSSLQHTTVAINAHAMCIDNNDWISDLCLNDGKCDGDKNKCMCKKDWAGELCQDESNDDITVTITVPHLDTVIRFEHEFDNDDNGDDETILPPQVIMNTQTNVLITLTPPSSSAFTHQATTSMTIIITLYYSHDIEENGKIVSSLVPLSKRIITTTTTTTVTAPVDIVVPNIDTKKAFFRILIQKNNNNGDDDSVVDDTTVYNSLLFTILPQCYEQPTDAVNNTVMEQWKSLCPNGSICRIDGKCTCPDGFTGDNCTLPINNDEEESDQDGKKCAECVQEHLSSCDDSKELTMRSTPCVCISGWGGLLCGDKNKCLVKSIDNCGYRWNRGIYETLSSSNSDKNVDKDGCSKECTCFNHWSGEECSECGLTCNNGGELWKSCDKCGCPSGYGGITCECHMSLLSITLNGSNSIIRSTNGMYSNGTNNSTDVSSSTSSSSSTTDVALKFIYDEFYQYFSTHFDVPLDHLNITLTPTTTTTTTIDINLMYNCIASTHWSMESLKALLDGTITQSIPTHFGDTFTPLIKVDSTSIKPTTSTLPPEGERLDENKAYTTYYNGNIGVFIMIMSLAVLFLDVGM